MHDLCVCILVSRWVGPQQLSLGHPGHSKSPKDDGLHPTDLFEPVIDLSIFVQDGTVLFAQINNPAGWFCVNFGF